MAKVINIPTRGSIGNVTHSANRSGQIQRQRAIPSQPRTVSQMAQRSRLGSMSAGWRGLTDPQRAAWNAFATSFTVVNSLGTSGNLTGHQCYVKVNTVLLLLGTAAVAVPPALPAFVACTATALTATAGTPTVALAGVTPASGTVHMLYASPQLSPGVSFNNNFRYLGTRPHTRRARTPLINAECRQIWGLIAGKRLMVKVVQTQAGMQDNGTVFGCIVGA